MRELDVLFWIIFISIVPLSLPIGENKSVFFEKTLLSKKFTFIVRRMRLELTRRNRHYPLKVACIPISPPAPNGTIF